MSDLQDQMFPGSDGPERLRRIVLEFESFRDFIQAFSPMVSEDGMFVSREFLGDSLPDTGEGVDFEVRLTDDFRLVHGRGQIAWLREQESAEGPAGVAVAFEDLDEPSRRLVTRLINNYVKDGGKAFQLQVAPETGGATVEPEPLARSEADELFASGSEESPTEQQELDSVAPVKAGELSSDVLASPPAGGLGKEPEEADHLADEVPGPSWDHEPLDLPEEAIDESEGELPELPPDLEPVTPEPEAAPPVTVEVPADEHLPQAGGAVISEDIAQIAEELSGVHLVEPVEMPTVEERVELAGAASARSSRSPWRTLLIASLAGIALGVAAWFFLGDQLKGFLGLDGGGRDDVADVAAMELAEPPPAAAGVDIPTTGDDAEPSDASAEAESDSAVAESLTGAEGSPGAEAEPAASEAEVSGAAADATPVVAVTVEQTADGASRIERITWSENSGETVVTIRVDGALAADSYEVVRIREGEPRELIKIFGISSPFSPKQLEIGSPQVEKLRTGLHERDGRSEIHIVADLAGPAAAVTLVRVEGNALIVTFS